MEERNVQKLMGWPDETAQHDLFSVLLANRPIQSPEEAHNIIGRSIESIQFLESWTYGRLEDDREINRASLTSLSDYLTGIRIMLKRVEEWEDQKLTEHLKGRMIKGATNG